MTTDPKKTENFVGKVLGDTTGLTYGPGLDR